MGLYQPMTSGIASFDIGDILTLIAGVVVTTALLARLFDFLLERYRPVVCLVIPGVVIASTLLIVPSGFSGAPDVIISLAFFAAGFAVACGMDIYGERIKKR
jgi:putative membrane protein